MTTDQYGEPGDGGRRHRGLAISGIVFVVLLIAIAGAVLLSLRQSLNPAHRAHPRYTYHGIQQVDINSGSSDVTVTAAPSGSDTVTVTGDLQWNRKRPTIAPRVSGHDLRVDTSCQTEIHWGFSTCQADLVVAVPASTRLTIHARSGDASVRGLSGAVNVDASSGNVTLTDLSGSVAAGAESGDVTATGLTSTRVRTSASSGNISLVFGTPPTDVTAVAASGDVTLDVPRSPDGYAVAYQVASGDRTITVDRDADSTHHLRVEASSGDVTVTYPTS